MKRNLDSEEPDMSKIVTRMFNTQAYRRYVRYSYGRAAVIPSYNLQNKDKCHKWTQENETVGTMILPKWKRRKQTPPPTPLPSLEPINHEQQQPQEQKVDEDEKTQQTEKPSQQRPPPQEQQADEDVTKQQTELPTQQQQQQPSINNDNAESAAITAEIPKELRKATEAYVPFG